MLDWLTVLAKQVYGQSFRCSEPLSETVAKLNCAGIGGGTHLPREQEYGFCK